MKLGIGDCEIDCAPLRIEPIGRSFAKHMVISLPGRGENFTTSRRVVWDLLDPGNLVTSLTRNPIKGN